MYVYQKLSSTMNSITLILSVMSLAMITVDGWINPATMEAHLYIRLKPSSAGTELFPGRNLLKEDPPLFRLTYITYRFL